MISLSGPRVIGSSQDGFDFLPSEEADEPLHMPFKRDGQDARHRGRQFRAEPVAEIAHKRAKGGQASVAGPGTVPALLLQVIQESEDDVGVNVSNRSGAARRGWALRR